MKRPQKRSVDKKPAFLAAFVASASLTAAAAAVGIDRSIHYDWLKQDPEYAKAFAAARAQAGDTLRDDAVRWARYGVFEPNVYQGRFQYAQRARTYCKLPDGREIPEDALPQDPAELARFEIVERRTVMEDDPNRPLGVFRRSEGLMARLLKAFLPEEFAERTELTGKDGGPVDASLTVTFVTPKDAK